MVAPRKGCVGYIYIAFYVGFFICSGRNNVR